MVNFFTQISGLIRENRTIRFPKPNYLISQTGSSNFFRFSTEEDFEDHHAQDGTNTSLVSSRTHAQPEEEDPVDEGTKAKGRSGREGER